MLLRGANPNVADVSNGYTPLHYAVNELQGEIVNLMLQKGAKVDAFQNYGETALQMAVTAGEAKDQARLNLIIKALLKAGANPNSSRVLITATPDICRAPALSNCSATSFKI